MSNETLVMHNGAAALKPGYADHAADALRGLRQSGDAVDFQVEHHHDVASTIQLGFWIYLMSDCLLFSGLFATYAVLHGHTAGAPLCMTRVSLDIDYTLPAFTRPYSASDFLTSSAPMW